MSAIVLKAGEGRMLPLGPIRMVVQQAHSALDPQQYAELMARYDTKVVS